MSELSPDELEHLAGLARLTLSADEKVKFSQQLPDILGFVDQLSILVKMPVEATAKTEWTSLAKLRADEESSEKLSLADLEKLAPAWREGQLEVPAVFGEVE